jgi:histidinol dehydrogenase
MSGVIDKDAHLILVSSMEHAVEICNAYAPEHASLMTRRDDSLAKKIRSAGALFLGGYSPVAVGDFLAGPSHTLPTGGGGKSFPGLMADMFQRRTSWVKLSRESLSRSAQIVETFSDLEGLDAHGRSVAIRLEPASARKSKQSRTPR